MSMWTHITACLSVETGRLEKKSELRRQIQVLVKDAPKITGSEGNADVFVNVQSGYNFYSSHDCEHCEYEPTLRTITDDNNEEYQECDAPDNYKCSGEYQTCVTISIQGDLRDRTKEETQKEFDAFLEYLRKNHCYMRDYAVNIEGE